MPHSRPRRSDLTRQRQRYSQRTSTTLPGWKINLAISPSFTFTSQRIVTSSFGTYSNVSRNVTSRHESRMQNEGDSMFSKMALYSGPRSIRLDRIEGLEIQKDQRTTTQHTLGNASQCKKFGRIRQTDNTRSEKEEATTLEQHFHPTHPQTSLKTNTTKTNKESEIALRCSDHNCTKAPDHAP
jgi:hypothetical protein